jgi:hypothetical protein
MPKKGWKATVLREEVYNEVEDLIRPKRELPKSVSEFIEIAVKEKLERLRREEEAQGSG